MMNGHHGGGDVMDGYSSYIRIVTDARVGELRREAAEFALSRAARRRRSTLWARVRDRRLQRRWLAGTPVVTLSRPASPDVTPLRRSA
jgi:hypothetical protein